jgi:hypothetical protein
LSGGTEKNRVNLIGGFWAEIQKGASGNICYSVPSVYVMDCGFIWLRIETAGRFV